MALSMKSQPCHKKHFLAYVFLCLFHIFVVVDGQAAFQAYSSERRRRSTKRRRRRGVSHGDGDIVVVDNGLCFQTNNYGDSYYDNYEDTTIKVLRSGTLNVVSWSGECNYDYLTWPSNSVSCDGPHGRSVSAGNLIRWKGDSSVTRNGFKVCNQSACGWNR